MKTELDRESCHPAFNKDLLVQMDYLTKMMGASPLMDNVFHKAAHLNIDHYYIGAGCIAQTVWNHCSGFSSTNGINDIDFVYFDSDLSYDKECEVINHVNQSLGDLPIRIDIKNQARVHLWYEQHFGYPIRPYASLEDAINTWPTTASAIGLRKDANGQWNVYAPYGLNDLFGLIVRANKVQITKEIYEKKVHRWQTNWPALNIIPWES
ncbi:nucleotidyltransferase family protein [Paenibacillus piri]|uniref:Nucleotidyltransferase family protein n=1 Tax=Paenibacillus piri TaxID=2547395 RepID=A0A4R5KGH1_9BACL|nr:nucleotidyltransferase family protein [Paenibacillus piri]TDF93788.1 nucleotidyltransferase family protein [Paenibacillus piri]